MICTRHAQLFQQTLFPIFPREIGFPGRKLVKSFSEFMILADRFHNEAQIFIQLYNVNHSTQEVEIDKLWQDLDSHNQFKLIKDLKIIYKKILFLGFSKNNIVIPYTGNKGFHIYAKLKSQRYSIEDAKKYLFWINSWLCEDLETPDSPLFGDTNRMVRFSGIQRPIGTFMIALDPDIIFKYSNINDYFVENKMAWQKILDGGSDYLKTMNGGAKLNLKELYEKIKATGFKPPKKYISHNYDKTTPIQRQAIYQGQYYKFLRKIITDEPLFYAIHAPNPRAIDRVRFARRMLSLGLTIDDCHNIIISLGWLDYKPEKTLYNLNYIKRKYEL